MRYIQATAATLHRKDGSTVRLASDAASKLYLHHNIYDLSEKRIELLGGRNEFERSNQKWIIDQLEDAQRPEFKRVLIVGDSIRMRLRDASGYGRHTYDHLTEHVNITHIPHNTGGTTTVLVHLANWLSCKPDIVHINAGLHDLATAIPGTLPHKGYNSQQKYANNLRRIMQIIDIAGVKNVIWASSTPIHDRWHLTGKRLHRTNDDVITYNKIAAAVMDDLNIPVNDLYQPTHDAGLENCLRPDGVHLSHSGSSMLGKLVADCILYYC